MQTNIAAECRKLETYGTYSGFRRFVQKLAHNLGVKGHIRKVDENHLEIVMIGSAKQLDLFVEMLLNNDGNSQIIYHDMTDFATDRQYESFIILPTQTKKSWFARLFF